MENNNKLNDDTKNIVYMIKELRQELLDKGQGVTQGDIIALIATYDTLLYKLTEKDVA